MEKFVNEIIQGDCREIMRQMPPESVDLVMFSPPYWGLRNYGEGTETVWGGDSNCQHDFSQAVVKPATGGGSDLPNSTYDGEVGRGPRPPATLSSFCPKCGAWKGQLGLEPHFQMYVEHLVEIGGLVWRVLKKTGSFYLNLGDTYNSHPAKSKKVGGFQGRQMDRNRAYQNAVVIGKPPIDLPDKCKLLIPHRVALALIDEGWICRNDIVWYKPNAMPSSVKDRLTCTYEYVFFFVKSKRYYYDLDAIREPHSAATIRRISERTILQQQGGPKQDALNPKTGNTKSNFNRPAEMAKSLARKLVKHDLAVGRVGNYSYPDPLHTKDYHPEGKNPGDVFRDKTANEEVFKVGGMRLPPEPEEEGAFHPLGKNPGDFWEITTKPFKDAHFAVYPPEICVRPILSSCPPDGIVLDPMCGSGTTCAVAKALGRNYIGIDINPKYVEMARKRVARVVSPLAPITRLREAMEAVR
jgi:site-specific DNA-methyltransferase (cytosine-N4-specific)